jgi:hypothetical protein
MERGKKSHPRANLFSSVAGITKLFSPAFMHSELSPDCGMACLGDLIKFKVHSFLENRNSVTAFQPQNAARLAALRLLGFKFQCLLAVQTLKDRKK